jgi:molybdenum cofactor cytidylyltransferase
LISGIVLAGGTSSRLGRPKQLLELEGRPVLQHVIDAATEAGLDEVVVVLGHMADDIAATIDLPVGARTCLNPRYASGQSTSLEAGLDEVVVVLGHMADDIAATIDLPVGARTCLNPRYASGQSTSLEAGLDAADPSSEAAVVLLGDQPRIGAEIVRAVVARYRESGARVVRAWYGGRPAHPVLFDRSVWDELRAVEGDRGARDLLKAHPDWESRLDAGDAVPSDLDTWEDYERLKGEQVPPA